MSTIEFLSIDGAITDEKVRSNLERWRDQINFLLNYRFDDTKSSTISTGVGSIKMSSANSATNSQWLPMKYNGTTYYIPAFTTNAP